MLDQKTTDIARQLIHPQLAERRGPYLREITNLRSEMVLTSNLGSIRAVLQLGQIACAEVKIRVGLVTKDLFRVVTQIRLPCSDTLAADLMHEIEIHAREAQLAASAELVGYVQPPLEEQVAANIENARVRALELARGEVVLFVHSLAAAESAPSIRPGVSIKVEGNVGALMAGSHSTANVVQYFGADEKQVVERALASVREYMAGQGNIPDLTEIVDEAEVEARKSKPNLAKLTALMSGIAIFIQTSAAAKPAYDAMKAALTMLGINTEGLP